MNARIPITKQGGNKFSSMSMCLFCGYGKGDITLQSQCHLFLHGIFQSVILKIPTFVFVGWERKLKLQSVCSVVMC